MNERIIRVKVQILSVNQGIEVAGHVLKIGRMPVRYGGAPT